MMQKLNSAPAKSQETTLLTIFQRLCIIYELKNENKINGQIIYMLY